MTTKTKAPRYNTPLGEVVEFCSLNKPSKQHDTYVVQIACDGKSEETTKLISMIDGMIPDAKKLAAEKGATAKTAADWRLLKPYRFEEVDGKETGRVIFSCKANGSITDKDTKQKSPARPPEAFNAQGAKIQMPNVGKGSMVRAAGGVTPWALSKGQGRGGEYGIKLWLNAVKIVDLVEYGGGTASSYGFGDDDGGTFTGGSTPSDNPDAEAAKQTATPTDDIPF
jgi:hypothetical protein